MKRILTAIDFSHGTDAVLFKTLELVKAFDAELCIIHAEPEGNVYAREEDNREHTLGLHTKMDFVRKEFQKHQIFPYMKEAYGLASECILRESHRVKPDLLIVGTQRDSKLIRLFGEHLREKLIAKVPCPVMLVHPDDSDGIFINK